MYLNKWFILKSIGSTFHLSDWNSMVVASRREGEGGAREKITIFEEYQKPKVVTWTFGEFKVRSGMITFEKSSPVLNWLLKMAFQGFWT